MTIMPMVALDRTALLLTLLGIFLIYLANRSSRLPYPPGPRKLPLLGNILDFPLTHVWQRYAKWSREYNSDILHLSAAGKDFIILNSFETATDLLDKRSSKYSDRPQFTMLNDLMGWDWALSGMKYGKPWKERRRLFQQYFSSRNVDIYRVQESKAVRRAMVRILDNSEDSLDIARHTIGALALSLAYGLKIRDTNDPFLDKAERALKAALDATLPGAFLVNFVPWLKYVPEWLPGAGFKRKAREWKKLQEEMYELPYAEAIENVAAGRAYPSLVSEFVPKLDYSLNFDHQTKIIKDTAAIVFTAAMDTTFASVQTFFVAMLCFPEVQKKAQKELDHAFEGRLPDFDDVPKLPYISALLKEIMRWRPAVPLGVPHQLTEDDIYKGYHIPGGAYVIANEWAMLQNEADYPDPSSFKPERFLTAKGDENPDVQDPSEIVFGFGRRTCPGANVAKSFLWIWIATFLSVFDIHPTLNENNEPVQPSVEYSPELSITFHPLPFKCTVKPRSKAAEELIRLAGIEA